MLASAAGYRTLLWDLDPQGAATHCYRARARVKGGAVRLLGGKRGLDTYIRSTDHVRLDLLPADPSFRVVDTVLAARRWPDRVIRKLLRPLERTYDVVILDCAPGLGVVAESVVAASDLVLAPVVPAPLSVRSLDQLQEFVDEHRPGLPLLAFMSMLDDRKVLHRQITAPTWMAEHDSLTRAMVEQYGVPMADLDVTNDEAMALMQYLVRESSVR